MDSYRVESGDSIKNFIAISYSQKRAGAYRFASFGAKEY
jgi:hypothetical protein